MKFFLDRIKKADATQVLATGVSLDEIIKPEILHEFKEKFKDRGELITTFIQFHITPTPSEKPVELMVRPVDFIELTHPSPQHQKDKVVVITSNRSINLDSILK